MSGVFLELSGSWGSWGRRGPGTVDSAMQASLVFLFGAGVSCEDEVREILDKSRARKKKSGQSLSRLDERPENMRVGVLGAGGRMGREVCLAVTQAADMELAAAVDPGIDVGEVCGAPILPDLAAILEKEVDAIVDFTNPDAVMGNLAWCLQHGIHLVVGTSGFTEERFTQVQELVGMGPPNVIVAPNFAIGAVLMAHLSEIAAPSFERVEVIEFHHDGKADAPSGTALNTAARLNAVRRKTGGWPQRGESEELLAGARGCSIEDVRVHAVRLPGLVAHQEVIFGGQGQTLTIRHDSVDRTSFMPGVLLALRNVMKRPGITIGLEPLLGLSKDWSE